LILNIPHSSLDIPPDIRRQFLLSDEELTNEIIRMTDSYTDELFNCQSASSIIFPVSRLVTDPERLAASYLLTLNL
jgi:N-formylglutamate amidohydrolase